MWKFCLEDKDSLDMMFIASWSDFTEGHEIEPTVENGFRELDTTLRYAAQFKDEKADARGLQLPMMLFKLRKEAKFLKSSNMDIAECNNMLDRAALLISQGRYPVALGLLSKISDDITSAKSTLAVESLRLREADLIIKGKQKSGGYSTDETLSIALPKELVSKLRLNNYTGYLYFEYLDNGNETLYVRSSTNREPKDPFKIVAKIRTDNSGTWKTAKVELFRDNIIIGLNSPTFYMKGNVTVKNLSLGYNIYTVK
jgi:hypothetical protein